MKTTYPMIELLIHSRSRVGLDWLNSFRSENLGVSDVKTGKLNPDDLINRLIPEIPGIISPCRNFNWSIMPGNYVLHLNISVHPATVEKHSSLDPYFFLQEIKLN